MQLQIYKISHPLIQLILSRINTKYISETNRKNYERYIGFLIIYEILRKYISIKSIYIKFLEEIKRIDTEDTENRYVILTDTSDTYNMITDITCITHNLEIIHIEYDNPNKIKNSIQKIYSYNTKCYIFIIEKITKNYKILNLLNLLIKDNNVSTNEISICNIFSCSRLLKEIGKQYPSLKIYTTKVE